MIRKTMLAAAAALLFATPAAAQSQQEMLDARYDHALAAGYKALFLCGAIANAELFGASRSEESVARWELTGIQSPLDGMVSAMPAFIERGEDGVIDHVLVEWEEGAVPRLALHKPDRGCAIQPMGAQISREPDSEIFVRSAVRSGRFAMADAVSPALAREAFEPRYGADARTTAALVVRGGKLVSEAYGPDHGPNVPQRTWSVAKSIAATIVGAAVQRGKADVNASAGLGDDEADPRRAITIDHLLRMASGRYSDTPGNRTDPLYFGGSTVAETAAHWPLIAQPGELFRYANNDTLMAIRAIEPTFAEHSPLDVLNGIGMHHTIPETDAQGAYVLSSQVWATARDLASLGQLYLDDGVLPGGQRVLPEGWRAYVSSPAGPQPEGGRFGYGAGFWLLNKSEGVPPDAFAAFGNRGQYVVIVPSRDVVIVRRGEDPAGGSGFDIAAFTRDVLAALPN